MKRQLISECATVSMNPENLGKKKNVLTRFLFTVATALCLFFVGPNSANAKPGIQVESSGAHYGTALYEEVTVDLEVKVMGGMARIKRQWKEETVGQWIFNPDWTDLDLKLQTTEIGRNSYVYKRASPTSNVYRYLEQNTIVQTESGFRWADRKGNWIDYDAAGKMLAYGDRNNVKVSFNRDASGRISQVLDHFGTAVITLAYNTQNQVISVSDYSGRLVVYTYTGNDLTKVKDVRGYDWLYEYQTLLNRRVLSKKIDPEGRFININHTVSPGGSTCVASSGGSWVFNEEKNQWELVGGKCTRYLIVPPTLLFTGTSDAIGVISKNQYFFDAQSQTYNNTWLVNGRRTTQKINLRGEVLREEINGELQSETVVSEDRRRKVVMDGAGHQTVFEYDEYGNQIKVIYPDKSSEEWVYGKYSNVLKYTNENGVMFKNDYDDNGNVLKKMEAVGMPEERVTEYQYDLYGNRVLERVHGDAVTQETISHWQYDSYGNVRLSKDAEGNEYSTSYTSWGDVLAYQGPQGAIHYTYDAVGNVVSRESPLRFIFSWAYDKVGNLISKKDSRDFVTTYEFNARNLLAKEILHAENGLEISENFYDANNYLTRKKNARGGFEQRYYDEFGRTKKIISPDGTYVEYVYAAAGGEGNAFSKPVEIRTPTITTHIDYSARGWPVKKTIIAQDGTRVISWGHDKSGAVTSETDAKGNSVYYEYNAFKKLTKKTYDFDSAIYYAYDRRGNLIEFRDQKNHVYRYSYDRLNRVVQEVNPLQAPVHYEYDAANNLTRYIDATGNVFEYTYDGEGRRRSAKQFSVDNLLQAKKTASFDYDSAGSLIGWQDGNKSSVLSYDKQGRLIGEIVNFGDFSAGYTYSYGKNGLTEGYQGPDQVLYTYSYDSSYRLTSVSIPNVGSITINSFFGREVAEVTFPGGVNRKIEYDGTSLMKKSTVVDSAGNTIENSFYIRDKNRNVVEIGDATVVREYQYTQQNWLASVKRTERNGDENAQIFQKVLSWDKAGNLSYSGEEWQYNAWNQLISRPGYSYSYDANGNQTLADGPNGQRLYHYDLEDRLVKVTDGLGALIAEYAYDPLGRRIWKKTATTERYYLYNSAGLAAELGSDGEVVSTYGFLPGADFSSDPIFLTQDGHHYFYINNQIGSPISLIDKSGNIVWSAEYNELGKATVLVEAIKNPLRNPGQYEDEETGIYYNYFRDFDPGAGRYLQTDPIGLAGGTNTYAYARGNPITYFDPKGLAPYPGCSWIEHLLGLCPDLDPKDFPKEWWDRQKSKWCGKPCDSIVEACKEALGPGCYASGTPCLAPCEMLAQQCASYQEEYCGEDEKKECPPENPPPPPPPPEPDPLTPDCTFEKWQKGLCS